MKKIISILTIFVMLITSTASPSFAAGESLTTNKTVYEYGEKIYVTASGGDKKAWVGIYKAGDTPGDTTGCAKSIYWYYSNGHTDGSIVSCTSGTTIAIQDASLNTDMTPELPVGEYEIHLFKDGSYNVAKTVRISIVDTSVVLKSISYSLDNNTDGYANGTVTVKASSESAKGMDCVMFWADGSGTPLNTFTALAKFKLTGTTTTHEMYDYTIIPTRAEKLIAYITAGDQLIGNPVSFTLPTGRNKILTSDYIEFQLISDIHVSSTGGAYGVANQHFAKVLEDIKSNSPDSIGIFVNGDISDTGAEADYQQVESIYNSAKASGGIPDLHISVGNHDWYKDNPNSLFQRYAKKLNNSLASQNSVVYYDETVAGYHFIYLGSESQGNGTWAELSNAQLNWLESRLAAFTAEDPDKPVFILLHQPLYNTVAGSLPGQGWHGVTQETALRNILKKYDQAIIAGGHSHWELNSKSNMYPGASDMCVAVNTASAGYLWSDYNTATGQYLQGSQGYYVRVYDDKVVFMGRDFVSGKYIPSACFVVQQNKITTASSYTVTVGGTTAIGASFADNTGVTYTSSNTSVVTVNNSGILTGVKTGTANITITAGASGRYVRNQVTVPVTVQTAAHSHSYGNWEITKTATCTETGRKVKSCSCGATLEESISINGANHTNIIIDPAVESTCKVPGLTEGKHCGACGVTIVAQQTAELKKHTEVVIPAVAATCKSAGSTEGKQCSACGTLTVVPQVIPKTAHTEVTIPAVAATCKETGLTEGKFCSVCNTITKSQEMTVKKAHTEVIDAAVDPTCTAAGKTEGRHCSVCSTVIIAQTIIPAKGHTPDSDRICTEDAPCTVCGTTVPGGEHTIVTVKGYAATCSVPGKTDGKKCSVCNENIEPQREIPTVDHTIVIDAAVAPSCTESGLTQGEHCTKCSYKVERTKVSATGHTKVTDGAVTPTCMTPGKTEGMHCSVCREILIVQTTIPARGHSEVTDKAVNATCTTTGKTEGKHCSTCGEVLIIQTTQAALGHIEVVDKAVIPTCTLDGKTEGKHCSRCPEILVAQKPQDALGHIAGAKATCTTAQSCEECGTILAKATGHTFVDATCDAGQTCLSCNKVFSLPKGHKTLVLPAKAATCSEEGCTTGMICTVCNYEFLQQTVIPKLPHEYKETLMPATLDQDGYLRRECPCGNVGDETVISAIETIALSKNSYTYDGKIHNPTVIVKDRDGNIVDSAQYSLIKSSGRKNVGKYTYTITFKDRYEGSSKISFTINPAKPSIKKPAAAKKAVTVKWKKVSKQASGYQVMVATNAKFTKNKKTITVIGASKDSKKVTKLKSKTKYYVKVRTYKTVKGVKYYSDWSKVKTIRTK